MAFSRRSFLTLTGASAAGVVLASPLKKLYAKSGKNQSVLGRGFGPLVPDPKGILDLPRGFSYRAFSQTGELMSDGNPVPKNHDGMAAFSGPKSTIILVRNHELSPNETPGAIAPDSKKYDRFCQGGTTTLIVDGDHQLIKDFVSLAGTNRNCAGGPTPWGSWISCEENTSTPSPTADSILSTLDELTGSWDAVSVKHGYNFEVPASGGLVNPVPLVAMGRFNHEAVAVDPKTSYVYQTEDRPDSCIYRFRPYQYGNLKAGGVLEALAIESMPGVDTSTNFPVGEPKAVEWIEIEDVDPQEDTLRYEAQNKGAAIFQRGEGACFGNGEVYWTCTNGGNARRGQVFRYDPVGNTIELFVESSGAGVLDYPDNLTLAPFGDLILCEDGFGKQFIVGVNAKGECYHFARNALNNSEFAGICFSPDGQTMFVNIQRPGITLAIWGPWNQASAGY